MTMSVEKKRKIPYLKCTGIVSKISEDATIQKDKYEITKSLAEQIKNQNTSFIPVWIFHMKKYEIGHVVKFYEGKNGNDNLLCAEFNITSNAFIHALKEISHVRFSEIIGAPDCAPDYDVSETNKNVSNSEDNLLAHQIRGLSLSQDSRTAHVIELSICLAGMRPLCVITNIQIAESENLEDRDKNPSDTYIKLLAASLGYSNIHSNLKILKDWSELKNKTKQPDFLVYEHMYSVPRYDETDIKMETKSDLEEKVDMIMDHLKLRTGDSKCVGQNKVSDTKDRLDSDDYKSRMTKCKKPRKRRPSDSDEYEDEPMDHQHSQEDSPSVSRQKKRHINESVSYSEMPIKIIADFLKHSKQGIAGQNELQSFQFCKQDQHHADTSWGGYCQLPAAFGKKPFIVFPKEKEFHAVPLTQENTCTEQKNQLWQEFEMFTKSRQSRPNNDTNNQEAAQATDPLDQQGVKNTPQSDRMIENTLAENRQTYSHRASGADIQTTPLGKNDPTYAKPAHQQNIIKECLQNAEKQLVIN